MFAAGMFDPIVSQGEMSYQGNKMLYPEDMGYPPENMGYPSGELGYPPGDMCYPPEDMSYGQDNMGCANDNMGYAGDIDFDDDVGHDGTGDPNVGPMPADEMVPHTYYEDDQYEEASDVEGEANQN